MNETEIRPARQRLEWLLLGWVLATALFFFLRFSLTFYYANQAAIHAFFRSAAD